ncbi:MAG: endolytic transglycosylase MltG [Gammaproteobacteria bacterium]
MFNRRNLIIFFAAFVVSAALSLYWLYNDMQASLDEPMNLTETGYLDIASGTGLSSVSRRLVENGWISHPWYLLLEARWRDQAHQLKAGEYAISPGTSQRALLDQLISGRVIQYSLTIPEGLTFREIVKLVRDNPHLVHTFPDYEPDQIVAQMDYIEGSPEGLFYPDTYHFPRGTTDAAFFLRAWQYMQKVLSEEWAQRAVGLPYQSPYEALIMASIIEKETGDPSERDRIAGVFVRRLQLGMRLQTDPTVIYAMGLEFDGDIRRRDLSIDSPYNTYVYRGLPPGPIASPGRASIRAALQPADGEELYFVSRGDGTHQFSVTLEEHNRAVREYILNRNRADSQ